MSKIADHIYRLLGDDMVSHGLLAQFIEQESESQLEWSAVLKELLLKDVEIGEARLASSDYVKFIAWNGKVDDRASRAIERVKSLAGPDREFAYWLALRKNVDQFEAKE